LLVIVGVVSALLTSTAPTSATTGGQPPFGSPIGQWTDAQIAAQLAQFAPGVAQMQADGSLLEGVPTDQVATVNDMANKIATPGGRLQLAADIRSTESNTALTGPASADDDPVNAFSSTPPSFGEAAPLAGDTTPKVKVVPIPNAAPSGGPIGGGTGGTAGGSPPRGGYGEGRGGPEGLYPECPAQGTMPDPDKAPMAFLTPRHDTFMGVGPDWPVYSGERQILMGTDGRKYLKVVVNMDDTKKNWPIGALDVRVWMKKNIGDHAGTVYGARNAVPGAPAGSGVFCYPSSSVTGDRGYAVVMVPMSPDLVDPGFQLYAELIEWDPWFQFGANQWEIALAFAGPQYWAGGEQITMHVGKMPQLSRSALRPAVGAFIDKGLIVNDDGIASNDMQSTIESLMRTTIGNKMASFQTDDLVGQWAFDDLTPAAFTDMTWEGEGQASFGWDSANPPHGWDWAGFVFGGLLAQIIDVLATFKITSIERGTPESLSLSYVGLGQGDSDSALKVGASFNDTKINGKLRLFSPFNCKGSLQVDANAAFRAWVEEGSPATGVRTHGDGAFNNMSVHDWQMPWYNWARPSCVTGWGIARLIAKGLAIKGATSAVLGLLVGDGDEPAVLQKIINGLNLPGKISSLSLPGGISPTFAGFRDSCATSACPTDESFLQTLGLDVMADGNLGPNGGSWGSPWSAVYSPTVSTDVASQVRSHASSNGLRDIGVIVNADLVNSALHDISAGGLLNVSVAGNDVKPSIVPMYLGSNTSAATPFKFVVPDLRAKIQGLPVALSIKLGVGATVDPVSGALDPTIEAVPEVEALDCQVDYGSGYGLAYGFCGHANNGNFGLPTLPQIINQLTEAVVTPLIDQSLGKISLPSLTAVTPGVALTFNTLEAQNRGGHIGLFADRTAVDPGASLDIWTPSPYMTWNVIPSSFPGTGAYDVVWQVKDLESGQLFSTAGCYGLMTCFVPGWMFQIGHPPGTENPKWRHAEATATVSRAGVSKTIVKDLIWIL